MLGEAANNGEGAGSVAEALAAFLKASFVYPASHARVQQSRVTLEDYLVRRGQTRFAVMNGLVQVDGKDVATDTPAAVWMRDCLLRAELHSFTLDATITAASLTAFADNLRKAYPSDAPNFATTWHEAPGVRLTELATKPAASASLDPNNVLRHLSQSQLARHILAELHRAIDEEYAGAVVIDTAGMLDTMVGSLPAALVSQPEQASARLEMALEQLASQLEGFLAAHPPDPGDRLTRLAVNLLKRALPEHESPSLGSIQTSDAFGARPAGDGGTATPSTFGLGVMGVPGIDLPIDPAERGWDASQAPPQPAQQFTPGSVERTPTQNPFAPAAEATHEVQREAAEFFGLDSKPAADQVPKSFLDLEDELISDDPKALVHELKSLPNGQDLRLELSSREVARERLGVGLHLLVHASDGDLAINAVPRLIGESLEAPNDEDRQLINRYVRGSRTITPGARRGQTNTRITDYIRAHDLIHLLNVEESVDVETVIQTFPAQLTRFLDSLDPKDPSAVEAFDRLMEAVGNDQLTQAFQVLIDDGTMLTPHRTEKILKLGGAEIARIAAAFAKVGTSWTRALVVNWLRRQTLPHGESAALTIIQPVTSIPPGWVADVCRAVADNTGSDELHAYTNFLLRQFLRDSAERSIDDDRKIYAIRSLIHWPTAESNQFLEQLSKSGRIVPDHRESKAVRNAATEVLRQIKSRRRS